MVVGPNFGMIEVEWEARMLSMQIRDARQGDTILKQSQIYLDGCTAV